MTTTTIARETMVVIRHRLTPLLAGDIVDALLEQLAEDLDAAGITAIATTDLEALRIRNHIYAGAMRAVGHAIEVAHQDDTQPTTIPREGADPWT